MTLLELPATSSGNGAVLGSVEPRIWTPPLRELTPDTSYGFDVIDFAERVLEHPLDPWQQWIVIHAGELLPDGRPRFRVVLILVARQNGKTDLLVVLTLYWLWIERVGMVLGTSTKLEYAAESWRKACRLARRVPALAEEIPRKGGIRRTNGEQTLWRADVVEQLLDEGSRYKVAASNEEGGRSLTIDRLVLDELRQHHDHSAWDASVPATTAVAGSQVWAISNAGSEKSIVLNEEQDAAVAYIKTGDGDVSTFLGEYSAPAGADPLDVAALAMANPNLGHRKELAPLLADAAKAIKVGGDKLTGFKTEHMCIRVRVLDPAIDPAGWTACHLAGDMAHIRDRVALCLDVSLDLQHAAVLAAAVDPAAGDRVRLEVVKAWSGPAATKQLRAGLRGVAEKVRPRVIGWLPDGPAASIMAQLRRRERRLDGKVARANTLYGFPVEEITGETTAVCMGLAEQVLAREIAHPDDQLINDHVLYAEKYWQGDAWRFTRRGVGHVNVAYAAAGAVHLARSLPPPVGKPRLIVAE